MKCLVCDNVIQIDTLKKLFAPSPLLLCGHCEQNLIPKLGDILFVDNEWIRCVIDKLNQGDMILINLFKHKLKAALHKKKATISNINIFEYSAEILYPWLEILVDDVLSLSNSKQTTSTELLVISVVSQKNTRNQISIIA